MRKAVCGIWVLVVVVGLGALPARAAEEAKDVKGRAKWASRGRVKVCHLRQRSSWRGRLCDFRTGNREGACPWRTCSRWRL